MIKNIFKIVACGAAILSMTACENERAKVFGGKMTIELEKDQKLVNCSWKSSGTNASSLWILTRPKHEGEAIETYKYIEKSTYGMLEGMVIIQEK